MGKSVCSLEAGTGKALRRADHKNEWGKSGKSAFIKMGNF